VATFAFGRATASSVRLQKGLTPSCHQSLATRCALKLREVDPLSRPEKADLNVCKPDSKGAIKEYSMDFKDSNVI
jgi:hypothetical protein